MRALMLLPILALACGPDAPGGTEGASTTTGTSTDSTSTPTTGTPDGTTTTSTTSTTGVVTTATTTGGDGLAEHGPCPGGGECASGGLCVQSEGASVCGPNCPEFGPGPAAGRCPPSPFLTQSICTWEDDVPGVCLITCGEASDCPDPGMVCVTCPEPFQYACGSLWGFSEKGPNICAWPGT